jgi:hypothetical protein
VLVATKFQAQFNVLRTHVAILRLHNISILELPANVITQARGFQIVKSRQLAAAVTVTV